ncbi:MAG: hypothetical protein KAU50_10620, partial [Candidatus Marinimicrobia bacterium]|nr:hypothetical protein [Candidatus Neomarinimicrobiota bacterium]
MNHLKIPRQPRRGIFSNGLIILSLLATVGYAADRAIAAPKMAAKRQFVGAGTKHTGINVLGLRVAFEADDDLGTTGTGQFLVDEQPIGCAADDFLVDPPPHDSLYFADQVTALANYFEQVSRGNITFDLDSSLIYPPQGDPPIQVSAMSNYSVDEDSDSGDSLLVALVDTVLQAAYYGSVDIASFDLIIIFHAGLGQDFSYSFLDPTPRDISSAYVDSAMIRDALGTSGIPLPDGSELTRPFLLAPESQNHIYYDIAEDIFGVGLDLCDVQVGLTGTLALLTGYALGLPPLFDTENGEPAAGVFALMDVGSNNGQGVIPAPPSAWTRIHMGWEQPVELLGPVELAARHLPAGRIGRVSLSNHEYLLVENRLNWLGAEAHVDIDSLRYRNATDDGNYLILPHYFNYLEDSVGVGVAPSGVIVSIPNYDIGLPGSGLLIWHVDESRYGPDFQSLNADREARAVRLVEADGAVDLGFQTTAFFVDPGQGWRWDMWYAGNQGYFAANPLRWNNNPYKVLSLDAESHPPLILNTGAEPGLAITAIDSAGEYQQFEVTEVNTSVLPPASRIIGFNGIDPVILRHDSLYLGDSYFAMRSDTSSHLLIISEHDAVTGSVAGRFWLLETMPPVSYTVRHFDSTGAHLDSVSDDIVVGPAYFDAGYLYLGIGGLVASSPDYSLIRYFDNRPWLRSTRGNLSSNHYLTEIRQMSVESSASAGDSIIYLEWQPVISLGDLDGDGLDEMVLVDTSFRGTLTVENIDRLTLEGYPVPGGFNGPALVANLLGDEHPEMVVVEGSDILVLSYDGRQEHRLALRAEAGELML